MKKNAIRIKKLLTLLVVLLMAVTVSTVFHSTETSAAPKKYVESLKLSKSNLEINAGSKKTVKVTVKVKGSASKKVKIKLSKADKKLVNVEVGKPNKKGISKLTITAKYVTKKTTVSVKVITVGKNNNSEKITKTIKVTVKPKKIKDKKKDGKLVVWTLASDVQAFADRYQNKTGVDVETIVISPAEYQQKLQEALTGGDTEPDIIIAEPQMLQDFYAQGFFDNLDLFGAQEYDGKVVDYVWQVGQDSDGVQRAIAYDITPAGVYYRRDIAKEVFGTDKPEKIGELFADYDTILSTAEKLKNKGYRIFASDMEMAYFSGDSAWVKNGKLNLSAERKEYMDLCAALYQKDLVAYAAQWTAPWYMAMNGATPILTADTMWGNEELNIWDMNSFKAKTENYDKTQVFAFGLPAWGMQTLKNNISETTGLWGICSGPSNGFGGGTYMGISANSERKATAWDFVKFCTLTKATAEWWINKSEGNVVSLISAMKAHKNDKIATYGGQKLYAFWLKQAQNIDYSKVTEYDDGIGSLWSMAVSQVKTGEKTKEEAIEEFYSAVQNLYPNIKIER